MTKRYQLFIIGGILFLCFLIFSYLVHKNLFTSFDFDTTVRLQDKISRKYDAFFSLLSLLGSFEVMGILLFIFLIIRRKIWPGLVAFFLFGMFHFLELYGKTFVQQLPPPEFMLRTQKFANFPQFYIRSEYSYPSGHAARTTFLSTLLILLIWKAKWLTTPQKYVLTAIILLFDITMGISRVYLGEHWASDIVGGILVGTSFGLLGSFFYEKRKKHRSS